MDSVGGRLEFSIDGDGDLKLKWAFRSANVHIVADGTTAIYLGWNRWSGKLIASREPVDRF